LILSDLRKKLSLHDNLKLSFPKQSTKSLFSDKTVYVLHKLKNFIINFKNFSQKQPSFFETVDDPMAVYKAFIDLNGNKPDLVFMSMAFSKENESVFYIVESVLNDFKEQFDLNLTLVRLDKRNKYMKHDDLSFNIHDSIYDLLMESSLVIADISSNSANVYHEIGLKEGYDKIQGYEKPRIIILKDRRKKVIPPFNILNKQYIEFFSSEELKTLLMEKLVKFFLGINK
jgi:hypothetical protein